MEVVDRGVEPPTAKKRCVVHLHSQAIRAGLVSVAMTRRGIRRVRQVAVGRCSEARWQVLKGLSQDGADGSALAHREVAELWQPLI